MYNIMFSFDDLLKLSVEHLIIIIFVIFVVILIMILLWDLTDVNIVEHFDTRIDGPTIEQCGTICTKSLGCNAFAYDKDNKYCYVSKDPIYFAPEKKAFTQFYTRTMPRCNKLYMINDPLYNSRNNLLRNSVYTCKDTEGDLNEKTKMYVHGEKIIDDVTKINQEDVPIYTFEIMDWNTVINFDKNLHLATNPTKSNSIGVMKEYDNEFGGQYLLPHSCSVGIQKKDCLAYCLNDDQCVGTEWNPLVMTKVGTPNMFTIEENVCCPKKRLNSSKKRNEHNRFGHFYMKEYVEKKDLKNNDTLVSYNNSKNISDVDTEIGTKYKEFIWNMY